jgi:NADPH:quinone reductase-like Zn-dependent oxidoreductase
VRAAVVRDGRIEVDDRPDPEAGVGQVLVRVRASGINAPDLAQRAGRYAAPAGAPADIPGLELAGEVAAVGDGVERFAPGDRVMALVGGGGHAELAAMHSRLVVPVPEAVGWDAAGGFVEVFATAHDALFTQAGLAVGERVLVQGAAGGVGVAAVQLARAAGASVVGTVRAPELRSKVEALGAEVRAPGDLDGAGPFDVVLELVGGDNLRENISLLATGGRVVVIGVGAGASAEIAFYELMRRRARIHASLLRPRPLEEKALVMRRVERHVLPLLADGRVVVPVHETFPLDDAQAGYERFAAGGKLGKIVLRMDG